MEDNRVVLCGANAYDMKYYFNEQFNGIPDSIKDELRIICVLFTEEVGGIFTIVFEEDGTVSMETNAEEDDIYYDEEGGYIQLVANGEPIGNVVELPDGSTCSITDCKVNEDGHLIVTLSDGRVIDAGYVGATDGVTFVPHISDDLILSWTNDGGLENPEPVDLNPFDEWTEIDGAESDSDYTWEQL